MMMMCRTAGMVLLFSLVSSFNVDTKNPYIYSSPYTTDAESSYFGYTVAIHEERDMKRKWLLVGAPRSHTEGSSKSKVKPGALFKCELTGSVQNCSEIIVDRKPNLPFDVYKNYSNWVGVSLDTQVDGSGNALVCGHRGLYPDQSKRDNSVINGYCYSISNDLQEVTKIVPFQEFDHSDSQIIHLIQGGTSAIYLPSSAQSENVMVGAPGYFQSLGSAILLKRQGSSIEQQLAVIRNEDIKYAGYSLTYGAFGKEPNGSPKYRIGMGAPTSNQMTGEVFMLAIKSKNKIKSVAKKKAGEKIGEYFGASILYVDINNDGYSDEIIGAPYYYNDGRDCGRVYVNMHNKKTMARQEDFLIGPDTPGSRFGESLASVGDINADGFNDIAVGAPFDGDGSVWIYLGQSDSVSVNPTHVLRGSDYKVQGFGVGISRGTDIDDNHYPDFAVGSFLSDKVVVFRTHPVANITVDLTSDPKFIRITAEKFKLSLCVTYTPAAATIRSLDIDVSIRLIDDTILAPEFEGMHSFDMPPGATVCRFFEGRVQPQTKEDSVNILAEYKMNNTATKQFDVLTGYEQLSPVLHPDAVQSKEFSLQFYKCDSYTEQSCQSDLEPRMSVSGYSLNDKIYLGRVQSLNLYVNLTNHGQGEAINPEIRLTLPKPLKLVNTKELCSIWQTEHQSVVHCRSHLHRLMPNATETMLFYIDVSKLREDSQQLSIQATVSSDTKDSNPDNDMQRFTLISKNEADIAISGNINMEQLRYQLDDDKDVLHQFDIEMTFQVYKNGFGPLDYVSLDVELPYQYKGGPAMISINEIDDSLFTNDGEDISCKLLTTKEEIDEEQRQCENRVAEGKSKDSDKNEDSKEDSSKEMDDGNHTVYPSTYNFSHDSSPRSHSYINEVIDHLSCSSPKGIEGLTCARIFCQIGKFLNRFSVITLKIPLQVDIKPLADLLEERNQLLLVSSVSVDFLEPCNVQQPEGELPDSIQLHSLILPVEAPATKVAVWVYILGSISGVLLLVIVIICLWKCNFFRRKDKERLIKKKRETAMFLEDYRISMLLNQKSGNTERKDSSEQVLLVGTPDEPDQADKPDQTNPVRCQLQEEEQLSISNQEKEAELSRNDTKSSDESSPKMDRLDVATSIVELSDTEYKC